MTQLTARRHAAGPLARAQARITGWKQRASDQVHRAGDAQARARGWTATPTTGRLGFAGRAYRDPRFDRRKAR